MRRALVVTGIAVFAVVCSCVPDNECSPIGESCVSPGVRKTCGQWDHLVISSQPQEEECGDGRRCVDAVYANGTNYAACAIGEREPRCDRSKASSWFCDRETYVRCHGAYREDQVDCTKEGLLCHTIERKEYGSFEPVTVAGCVRSREPDPRCGDGERTTFCDGDLQVTCFGPHAGRSHDCRTEGRFCREGFCRLSPEPDPRCIGRSDLDRVYCDGDLAVLCDELGYRRDTLDCSARGQRCVEILAKGSDDPNVRCQ